MKKFFKTLFFLFGIILLLVACFFGYFTLTDYKPEMREVISSINHPDTIKIGESFSVLTWNIGYAGLDKDMDFFYDGGTKVRPEEKQVLENMEGIASFLKSNDSIDFFLLQEVPRGEEELPHQPDRLYGQGIAQTQAILLIKLQREVCTTTHH